MKKLLFAYLAILLILIFLDEVLGIFFMGLIHFHEEIFYAILGIGTAGIVHWLFKSTSKAILRKRLAIVFAAPFVFYAGICLLAYAFPASYEDCDKYTKLLNGGLREFQGKKYFIQLCGADTVDSSLIDSDEIRMQVLDENGEVLALRYFTIRSTSFAEPKELDYERDTIFYIGHPKDQGPSALHLPPTKIDWIQARLPLFN
jgi:hypothetical protein